MPLIPVQSDLVRDIRAVLPGAETMPPDAIVVRGYPGGPFDVLRQANRIFAAYNGVLGDPQINVQLYEDQFPPAGGPPPGNSPMRIYLTAELNCWVEIDDWGASVLRVDAENSADRHDASIVWLRRETPPPEPQRIEYRVVTVKELGEGHDFVSGPLVQEYMTRSASNNVVWDEQQYGPTTGKLSYQHCF
jgi:hypothetical protein